MGLADWWNNASSIGSVGQADASGLAAAQQGLANNESLGAQQNQQGLMNSAMAQQNQQSGYYVSTGSHTHSLTGGLANYPGPGTWTTATNTPAIWQTMPPDQPHTHEFVLKCNAEGEAEGEPFCRHCDKTQPQCVADAIRRKVD